MLQEQVKELGCLNFLKRLSLYNNKISDMWILPSSLEIVNLSFNYIKKMPLETCKKLKNVTTLDIQSNKLETLENFEHLSRLKRLLAMNNYVRDLVPLQSIKNIFEIDLESNAVDSHIDFVNLIKGKNDLIVFNLYKNPLMVETETIEKFNEDLIQFAP
jgi:Leucine-rich repeat (LRR) protein